MKQKSVENEINEFRDSRSMELFNKHEWQLELDENILLDKYIKDYTHPVQKPIIIDNTNTGCYIDNLGNGYKSNGEPMKKYQVIPDWYISMYIPNFGLYSAHRLVAHEFIANPENKPQINHINGIKYFNWVGNLEWVTAKENAEHAWKTGLTNNYGEKQGNAIYTNDQVKQVCEMIVDGYTDKEIEQITGVKSKAVWEIRAGRKWRSISKEFGFKYITPQTKLDENGRKISPKALYSDDTVKEGCRLMEDPYISLGEISKRTGISVNTLKDIKKGNSYSRISSMYNICNRINYGQSNPLSKNTNDQILKVAELLMDPYTPLRNISEITGVKLSTVYDVYRKRRWKTIIDNYNFPERIRT